MRQTGRYTLHSIPFNKNKNIKEFFLLNLKHFLIKIDFGI